MLNCVQPNAIACVHIQHTKLYIGPVREDVKQ